MVQINIYSGALLQGNKLFRNEYMSC